MKLKLVEFHDIVNSERVILGSLILIKSIKTMPDGLTY